MTEQVFVDTSAWYALRDQDDPAHRAVRKAIEERRRLVTSTYVFSEAVTLMRARFHHAAAVTLGTYLRDPAIVTMLSVDEEVERQAWELFQKREDQEYSFTDCTSFVLMRREGISTCVALDDDFRREGFTVLPR